MLDENSSTPLYIQLYEEMLGNINSNRWPEGTLIPTESELCEQYGISRITVRLALDKLKTQGYLYRKQGRGTFVTIPGIEQPLTSFYSFSDPNGTTVRRSVILSFQSIPANAAIAAHLSIPLGDPVFVTNRVRYMNDIPFAYEFSYIPCQFCPTLNEGSIATHGLYKSLQLLAGASPNHARETFHAVKVGTEAAQHLKGRASEPALSIQRTAYLNERIIEYCDSIVRGDRITYQIELHRL
jgi:GntR family transcriptional regulator